MSDNPLLRLACLRHGVPAGQPCHTYVVCGQEHWVLCSRGYPQIPNVGDNRAASTASMGAATTLALTDETRPTLAGAGRVSKHLDASPTVAAASDSRGIAVRTRGK